MMPSGRATKNGMRQRPGGRELGLAGRRSGMTVATLAPSSVADERPALEQAAEVPAAAVGGVLGDERHRAAVLAAGGEALDDAAEHAAGSARQMPIAGVGAG